MAIHDVWGWSQMAICEIETIVCVERVQQGEQFFDIIGSFPMYNVEIFGRDWRTVKNARHASHNDELDSCIVKQNEELIEALAVRHDGTSQVLRRMLPTSVRAQVEAIPMSTG
jgi:hypothetical protein